MSTVTIKDNPDLIDIVTDKELFESHPDLREPLIFGLLRRGEYMNCIAATKVGKSWLAMGMAYSVQAGIPWLGLDTVQGDVLLIDNELHRETLSYRLRTIKEAMGITHSIDAFSLRGRRMGLPEILDALKKNRKKYSLIILDALYRLIPSDMSENDNAQMTSLYNQLDDFAMETNASLVIIHHSSKGNQSEKSVTDVGSGAGSQSRAVDAHLVIRAHEDPNLAVLDVNLRSWAPLASRTIEWCYPLWTSSDVKPAVKGTSKGVPKQETTDKETKADVAKALGEKWKTEQDIRNATGFGAARVKRGLKLLSAKEKRMKSKKTGKSILVYALPNDAPTQGNLHGFV